MKNKFTLIYQLIVSMFFAMIAFGFLLTVTDSVEISALTTFGLVVVSLFVPMPKGAYYITVGVQPTQAQKLVEKARRLGNPAISKMQGTTRTIYDTLPIDGRTVYQFFENCGARAFPRTNLTQNQLSVGETMVIKRMSLSVITFDAVTGAATGVAALSASAAAAAFYAGDFSLNTGNNTVIKPFSMVHLMAQFNKDSHSTNNENLRFYTDITLQSLTEFVAILKVPAIAAIANKELRLTIEGVGSILNVRDTY